MELISARDAFKLAYATIADRSSAELERERVIFMLIEEAANRGEYSLAIKDIPTTIELRLLQHGFRLGNSCIFWDWHGRHDFVASNPPVYGEMVYKLYTDKLQGILAEINKTITSAATKGKLSCNIGILTPYLDRELGKKKYDIDNGVVRWQVGPWD